MNRLNYFDAGGYGERSGAHACPRRSPASSYFPWPPNWDRRPNYRRYRPPDPPPAPFPNFIIELHREREGLSRSEVKRLISECTSRFISYGVFNSGKVAARLFFVEWICAMETMVQFWESKFCRDYGLLPVLVSKLDVESDTAELNERLKGLFVRKIKGLIDGEIVKNLEKKRDFVSEQIAEVSRLLRRRKNIKVLKGLSEKMDGLVKERKLIEKRHGEFMSGLDCILNHLEGKEVKESGDGVCVFQFKDGFNWSRVYHLIMRECQRLKDGLPIYAYRQEILDQISTQQIIVLNGETGSGKSTQLVQFLADSGLFSDGCIVCTQPRKVAAISLAHRVGEESSGCYGCSNSVSCCPSYSSAQNFNGMIVFMTDHCLLQHCMNNRNLSGVSCIIVDEAHERSLNTDLLLALVKKLLLQRHYLRLIIMSATADVGQLSRYFFDCGTFKVGGRTFPVEVNYVPHVSEGTSDSLKTDSANVGSYVCDVVWMATKIHKEEGEGAILAFLTSQAEVEWACERFCAPQTVVLALHGKLPYGEQSRVFQNYPGVRKVIFATNVAETSLTIPGVKYVIDPGLAKDCRFEPGSGMNVLRVSWISRSSANQRAGRAGRTEPGRCYRLYSKDDFELMSVHQEPEIRRVHLGIAVLKILALGIRNIEEFDFIDAPSPEAIDLATQNLVHLGAVTLKNGSAELTEEGQYLVKLGIEPRLGKLILGCYHQHLGREGLVLAAVMVNSGNIFCRVGDEANKRKSDCLKVPFCHQDGDLFTLLSVYKQWEALPWDSRNKWCWDNSINAKSMRRCHDAILELESCLKIELSIIIPSYWNWRPDAVTEHDKYLKRVILASLAENVAMYSGCDHLGYQVALTGKYVKLHPSCSLLMFTDKPNWVVFSNILAASGEYLVCVTAFDLESSSVLSSPLLFDVSGMESQKLQTRKFLGFSKTILRRFCGKYNNGLLSLLSRIRTIYLDERISIEVNVDSNEIQLYASSRHMQMVANDVKAALRCERRWLQDECMEKFLYHGGAGVSPVALFGAGAQIKHLELDRRCLTVDIYCSDVNAVKEKDLLACLEEYSYGICAVHRFSTHGLESNDSVKWGSVTFCTPDAANRVSELEDIKVDDLLVKVKLSQGTFGVGRASNSYPEVRAKVFWPRRYSRGSAIVKCAEDDVRYMVDDFSNLVIGGRYVWCQVSTRYSNSVVIHGIDRGINENEVLDILRTATSRKILSFFLLRGDPVDDPPLDVCEEALLREISLLIPNRIPHVNCCRVHVFPPNQKGHFMEASIIFDGRLHLEAARALEQIEGKVLPCCLPWQKIRSQQIFHSSVSCLSSIYHVVEKQLNILIANLRRRDGVKIIHDWKANGSFQVKIFAHATKIVAEVRRPLEQLMKGKTITNASLTLPVLRPLFSKDGIALMQSVQEETGTYILFDRQLLNVRIFGPSEKVAEAEQRLVQRLLDLYEDKVMEIPLRGGAQPRDLMKQVVNAFGPDFCRLKEKVAEAEVTLDTRRHVILIRGNEESKQKVKEAVYEIAQSSSPAARICNSESTCPICLCDVEDEYQLENCLHMFCRMCIVEQLESAIRNRDSFPIGCAHEGCGAPIWLSDLKSLLSAEKLDDLFRASLASFMATSGGKYRFCPSPDCPSIYRVSTGDCSVPFLCGACYAETCTKCHVEYHPYISCEKYREFKEDPDSSLNEWREGKDYVKSCPVCGYTIEKVEGCNHVECKCGVHVCWFCLDHFCSSDDCYAHLRGVHDGLG